MSTTFGITTDTGTIIEVAFRGNGQGVHFTNDLAYLLPDDKKVIPLDNSAQGIETIGDIKKAFNR